MRSDRSGDARLRFLEAAEAMLCTSGMAGTGIKDVAARGGAPIGSLYHYFPGGKAQLVAEAVELNAARVVPLIEKLFAEDRDPARCVRQFFDTVADGFERAGCGKGCAIGAVALDVTPDDDGI